MLSPGSGKLRPMDALRGLLGLTLLVAGTIVLLALGVLIISSRGSNIDLLHGLARAHARAHGLVA